MEAIIVLGLTIGTIGFFLLLDYGYNWLQRRKDTRPYRRRKSNE